VISYLRGGSISIDDIPQIDCMTFAGKKTWISAPLNAKLTSGELTVNVCQKIQKNDYI
jgi:hypothetical protein